MAELNDPSKVDAAELIERFREALTAGGITVVE